jgi:hypothetical protein
LLNCSQLRGWLPGKKMSLCRIYGAELSADPTARKPQGKPKGMRESSPVGKISRYAARFSCIIAAR